MQSHHEITLRLEVPAELLAVLQRVAEAFAGWSSSVARQAHNLEVGGSNPPPATSSPQGEARPAGSEPAAILDVSSLPVPSGPPSAAAPDVTHRGAATAFSGSEVARRPYNRYSDAQHALLKELFSDGILDPAIVTALCQLTGAQPTVESLRFKIRTMQQAGELPARRGQKPSVIVPATPKPAATVNVLAENLATEPTTTPVTQDYEEMGGRYTPAQIAHIVRRKLEGVKSRLIAEELMGMPGAHPNTVALDAKILDLRKRGLLPSSTRGLPYSVAAVMLADDQKWNGMAPMTWQDAMLWGQRNGVRLGDRSEDEDLAAINARRIEEHLPVITIIAGFGRQDPLPDPRVGATG